MLIWVVLRQLNRSGPTFYITQDRFLVGLNLTNIASKKFWLFYIFQNSISEYMCFKINRWGQFSSYFAILNCFSEKKWQNLLFRKNLNLYQQILNKFKKLKMPLKPLKTTKNNEIISFLLATYIAISMFWIKLTMFWYLT